MRPLSLLAALLAVFVLAACGGSDDEPATTAAETTPTAVAGDCSEIEEVEIGPVSHRPGEFTVADYETNPPAGGDHSDPALEPGGSYEETAPLGEAVHFLEHGAVIGWTNDLSEAETKAVQDAFKAAFDQGYYQVATVELPELGVPFALSAWGALQTCDKVDTSVIQPFIEQWYASPKSVESSLACQGSARSLPAC